MTFRNIAFALALTLGFSVQAARPTPGALFKKALKAPLRDCLKAMQKFEWSLPL